MSEQTFYNLEGILKKGAHYNLIIGERSNGKTYSVLRYALERWSKEGEQLAIIRRFKDDFTGQRGAELFSSLTANGEVERITNGEWNGIYYYASRWYLARFGTDKKGKPTKVTSEHPFAFGFALTSMEHDKGAAFPGVKTVLFDEFLSRMGYLPDEFLLFTNTLSTIIRQRNDVKIFMLGNTVTKHCPYFAEMGLKHLREMSPGDIDLYEVGDSGLKIAVELCGTRARHMGKKSDVYFSFDNPRLKMITRGEWELEIYPHCPRKYTPSEIVFMFFLDFEEQLFQCEVVAGANDTFLYIHRKSTPIKHPDRDLVFSQKYDPRPNWRRTLTKPSLQIEQKLGQYFRTGKVYYQDNEVGETVRAYLLWSSQEA